MAFIVSIAEISIFLFGGLLLIGQMLAHEAGFQLGRRRRAAGGQAEIAGIVVGGMLGLLAFVLALTLSFSNSRFAERRQGTLVEANAIGTAWLRAKAIGTPRGEEIARLLEEYTGVRKDFLLAEGGQGVSIDTINDRTNAMQSEIWGHLAAVVREQPGPISASLMTSLNDAFDAAMSERFAFLMRLPPQIFWLLLGMTFLSLSCLGYQLGLKAAPARILVGLLSLMWTVVIVDILDLSAAHLGNFRTGVAVYEWTQRSFQGGITVPPLPSKP